MFSKKLLTLACVAGILACGACLPFGGGKPTLLPTPPPPLRPEMQGIRNVVVAVTNTSESRHLAPSDLAQTVMTAINRTTWQSGVSAVVAKDAGSADAVLAIEVLSESVTPAPDFTSRHTDGWNFQIRTLATLTRKDGQVVWRDTREEKSLTCELKKKDSADPWKAAGLSRWPHRGVSNKLVDRMLYGK